ncbi:hypothetical protein [Spirosoma linguale]|uniref:Uncharacterized protein n=1 Tax=Spirosoma linguale (strain ATCC 33905 / DSM 74 / LMG 10896 / Claus 1) TaxID=504472 RepID=D2QVA5_SPILD|nr:hypothetical protein Slin_6785 [Spirosoma linguale DSM 74]
MAQAYHTLLDLMGVSVGLGLMGWCLYRLAILFGIVSVIKRAKKTGSKLNTDLSQQSGKNVSSKSQKRTAASISRQALYSARKHRG